MKHPFYLLLVCIFISGSISAQERYFSDPIETFTGKKPSYITLKDGSEIEGEYRRIKRKRGLIETIVLDIKDKKTEIKGSEIAHMYLPQSSWDKFDKLVDVMDDVRRWSESDLNEEYLKDGYAYFESSNTIYKKNKEEELLLQLLNPAFSSKVKVYHDPYATESGTVSFGGVAVAGGDDKSYYIKVGDEKAYKLKRKDYRDVVGDLFGDCDIFEKDKDFRWMGFGEDLYNYTQECNN